MFKRLHIQMTFFCTLVTSLILVTMSCVCLYIAESGIKKEQLSHFHKQCEFHPVPPGKPVQAYPSMDIGNGGQLPIYD